MDLLLWIVFGAIAGWIASAITHSGSNTLWDIVMGIVGAVVGGWIFNQFGQPGVTGFNLYSFIVAIAGAAIVIWLGRALRRTV